MDSGSDAAHQAVHDAVSDSTHGARLLTRRRFIAAAGAGALLLGGNAFGIEPQRVTVTRHRIVSSGANPDGDALRLVQLTDLHLQKVDGHARKIARAINELRPDIVVLTGDTIDRADRIEQLREFLSLLDGASIRFATLGNWEHWGRIPRDELSAAYEAGGVRLLVNETVVHEHRGQTVLITGMDDWTGGRPDAAAALGSAVPQSGHIVLAHSPVYRDVLADLMRGDEGMQHSIDCVLSGHTHGGQVALFGWAPVRPAGSGPYVSGWYLTEGAPPLYVSRGLGTSLLPVRLGAPPELACFEWVLPARIDAAAVRPGS